MNYVELARELKSPAFFETLNRLYGQREGVKVAQMARYTSLLKLHDDLYHSPKDVLIVSAPGRVEMVGNHTDHNQGKVLACAVNLDTVAVVAGRDDMTVKIASEGYAPIVLSLNNLAVVPHEQGSTAALVRGVAARMKELGYQIGGFEAAITSDVLSGSGLSSSAAFEVLMVAILDQLYNDNSVDAVLRAQISQFAENQYFGKPSGLMDQMASSVGGLVAIDFKTEDPVITPLAFNFADAGFAMVVVNTGGSHDDLTDAYAAVRSEMHDVARVFGEDSLRRVRPEQLALDIQSLRGKAGDRAILRAMHYFDENERVDKAVHALSKDDLPAFFDAINGSGLSSWTMLQNVWASVHEQPIALAQALARRVLGQEGATRVHGGGFAGTTLNFVPLDRVDAFIQVMNRAFGERSCLVLDVRPVGAVTVLK